MMGTPLASSMLASWSMGREARRKELISEFDRKRPGSCDRGALLIRQGPFLRQKLGKSPAAIRESLAIFRAFQVTVNDIGDGLGQGQR